MYDMYVGIHMYTCIYISVYLSIYVYSYIYPSVYLSKCLGKQDLMSRNDVAKNANISNLTSRKCDGLDSKGFLTILF